MNKGKKTGRHIVLPHVEAVDSGFYRISVQRAIQEPISMFNSGMYGNQTFVSYALNYFMHDVYSEMTKLTGNGIDVYSTHVHQYRKDIPEFVMAYNIQDDDYSIDGYYQISLRRDILVKDSDMYRVFFMDGVSDDNLDKACKKAIELICKKQKL